MYTDSTKGRRMRTPVVVVRASWAWGLLSRRRSALLRSTCRSIAHLSSRKGDLPVRPEVAQQTGAVVGDFDRDGINFILSFAETAGPGLVPSHDRAGTSTVERTI